MTGQCYPYSMSSVGIGTQTDLVRRIRIWSRILAGIAALQGAAALVGWAVGNEMLKGAYASNINIKTNTAIALLLSGLSLLLLARRPPRNAFRTWLGRILAVAVIVIGLATLSEHVFGWNLGIDEYLFPEGAGIAATQSPNRMGPPASICFSLLGAALLLLDWRTRSGKAPSQYLPLAALVIAFLPFLGYVYGDHDLYGVAKYTAIALSTAICLILLSLAVIFARCDAGPARLLAAEDAGGIVVRRLLPATIIIPIALGWLRLVVQDLGLYEAQFGTSLLTLTFIGVFSVLIWWNGAALSRLSAARERAEAAERELSARLLIALDGERDARERAEKANRTKDEFLATLSHELRTPLNAILGWAQVLAHKERRDQDLDRGLEAIERNSRLQARLIEDLLDMSRIVSGKIRLDFREVALDQIVEAALVAIAPSASAKGVTVGRGEIDPAVRPIHGDSERIHQILWNLLSNAVKFTPPGGTARVSLRRADSGVEIIVSDNGIGIPPALLTKVFDQFLQADASTTRRQGGLGLGLSIARSLAKLHGGSITAASDGEGKGASFTVRLPMVSPIRIEPEKTGGIAGTSIEAAGREDGLPPDRLAGVRVLVIDDQEDGRELGEQILRSYGAGVDSAEGAARAIELIERANYDVLVCDIAMPGRDGYDLIREIRGRGRAIPAIALTAFAHVENEKLALDAGYQIHLAKPIDPKRLANAVAELAEAARPANTSD